MKQLNQLLNLDYMIGRPFSLVNDGTSDTAIKKMNALCALIFDVNNSKSVEFKFYDMCTPSGEHCSKASTLFDAIDSSLTKEGLDWDNVVYSFGLDNTNSNIGNKNSVKSRVLEKYPQCFIAGCNCHLAHLAAKEDLLIPTSLVLTVKNTKLTFIISLKAVQDGKVYLLSSLILQV